MEGQIIEKPVTPQNKKKDGVVSYFKVISQNSSGRTEEYCRKP
jgi:hypothetical protein